MTHILVPSDHVAGMTVYARDGEKLGTVERLMLEKATGQVAYAVVRHSGFLGTDTHHYPVLWNTLKYKPERRAFEADLTLAELRAGVSELDGDAFDWGDRAPPYPHATYWGV
jgi:sporulation protein YlmC with PRC-barrel domain